MYVVDKLNVREIAKRLSTRQDFVFGYINALALEKQQGNINIDSINRNILEMTESGKSAREISQTLNVSTPHVLALLELNPEVKKRWEDVCLKAKRDSYRIIITEVCKEYPDVTREQLIRDDRFKCKSVFAWLMRYDREWLLLTVPHKYCWTKKRGWLGPIIDWDSRYQKYSLLVEEAKNKILSYDHKIIRVSVAAIAREINAPAIKTKAIDKLPLTKNAINNNLESDEEYKCRRIYWVAKKLKDSGKPLTRTLIYQYAHLKQPLSKKIIYTLDYVDSIYIDK
jgi:hypothetical protein